MGTYDSVAALLAVAASTGVVLRHVASHDRPAPPAETAGRTERAAGRPVQPPAQVAQPPVQPAPRPAQPAQRPAERAVVTAPVVPAPPLVEDGSILAALAATERDEHSVVRRLGAVLVLLAITLLTAVAVGLLIYKGVSAFK